MLHAAILGAGLVSLNELAAATGDWWLLLVAVASSIVAGSALAIMDHWARRDRDLFF